MSRFVVHFMKDVLGGMAVAAGYGWTSTGLVGAGLALAGFVVWAVAAALAKRDGI